MTMPPDIKALLPDDDSTTLTYSGLTWDALDDGHGLYGTSDLTPLIYLVLPNENSIVLDVEAGCARTRLGIHSSHEAAVDAAEVHDFAFFETLAQENNLAPIFRGSRRDTPLETDDFAVLRRHAAPGVGTHEPTAPDGRPFSRSASFFQARKDNLKQNRDGSLQVTFTIASETLPLWLQQAKLGQQILMAAAPHGPPEDPTGDRERDHASRIFQRSLARPSEPSFQEFMYTRYDRWGLIATAMQRTSEEVAEATKETMNRVIGVPTRADLKLDRAARERFEHLDREFYAIMAQNLERANQAHQR